MSSLLQNIKRNIRTRRGPTSHSPSRGKSEKEKTQKEKGGNDKKSKDEKAKGLYNDRHTQPDVLLQQRQTPDFKSDIKSDSQYETKFDGNANTKDELRPNDGETIRDGKTGARSVTTNSYIDNRSMSKASTKSSTKINRSMDDLRSSTASPLPSSSKTGGQGSVLPSGDDHTRSRSRKVSVTPPGQKALDGRPPRSRSAYAGIINGGTFEDSGVDLDSSQGGASLTSDAMVSPLHSRDNSHSSHAANVNSYGNNSHVANSNSHVGNVRVSGSAFVHQGKLLQAATAKLSSDYISMNGRGEIINDGRESVMGHHTREVSQISQMSQSSSRSTNSSGSSSKSSHKGDKRQHLSPSVLSQPHSQTSQEEVYVKMSDFDQERSLSPPHRTESAFVALDKDKTKHQDHEYVNLMELAKDNMPKSNRYHSPSQSAISTSGNVNHVKEVSRTSPKDTHQQIQVQIHNQPKSTQEQTTSKQQSNQRQNHTDHSNGTSLKYRKPISEESDLESNSESVTSQEVAVLTAISRRRRGFHNKHASFPNAKKSGNEGGAPGEEQKFNKSLVSFAEQSILSFLSHLDHNSESESDTNSATRCEHATRKFKKTSPTPTNISSDTGGSPVRTDAATPTNDNQKHSFPSLHQIVACYDLVSLTLSKVGYNYPHYGIHVTLQKFKDHFSPTSERSVSSRNSKSSKSGSLYTPPGGFTDDYMLPTVIALDQDGVAGHDGRIRTGDYIIEVNGINVLDKTADETESLMNSEEMLHIVTTRGRSAIR